VTELLLLSNSRAPGMAFLEHATDAIGSVLGDRARIGWTSSTAGSIHQGETRQQRIEEFLEENDVPVLGLREGTWLRVSGPQAVLGGVSTGRLFRRGVPPANVPAGTTCRSCLAPRRASTAGRRA